MSKKGARYKSHLLHSSVKSVKSKLRLSPKIQGAAELFDGSFEIKVLDGLERSPRNEIVHFYGCRITAFQFSLTNGKENCVMKLLWFYLVLEVAGSRTV